MALETLALSRDTVRVALPADLRVMSSPCTVSDRVLLALLMAIPLMVRPVTSLAAWVCWRLVAAALKASRERPLPSVSSPSSSWTVISRLLAAPVSSTDRVRR